MLLVFFMLFFKDCISELNCLNKVRQKMLINEKIFHQYNPKNIN